MQARMNHPAMVVPDAMKVLQSLGDVTKKGLPEKLLELVHLRASQINGCSVCVDMHPKIAKKVGEKLKARKETVGVSESSAGGLISAVLLAVPGASAYFMGGAVVYTRPAGEAFLTATPSKRAGIRSSSEPWATLAAELVRERLGTTWGLAETGASGPTGNSYGDPAGHTCVAVVGPKGKTARTLRTDSNDRVANMRAFAAEALKLLDEQLT